MLVPVVGDVTAFPKPVHLKLAARPGTGPGAEQTPIRGQFSKCGSFRGCSAGSSPVTEPVMGVRCPLGHSVECMVTHFWP